MPWERCREEFINIATFFFLSFFLFQRPAQNDFYGRITGRFFFVLCYGLRVDKQVTCPIKPIFGFFFFFFVWLLGNCSSPCVYSLIQGLDCGWYMHTQFLLHTSNTTPIFEYYDDLLFHSDNPLCKPIDWNLILLESRNLCPLSWTTMQRKCSIEAVFFFFLPRPLLAIF